MQTRPAISLHEVTKIFGRFAAVRGVTAIFETGKLYVLLGDNGTGKSTLLRMLAGLSQPSTGSISLCGSANVRSVTAKIGYMGHASFLYEEMSGRENLRYFAGLYGIRNEQVIDDAIASVELDPALPRRVSAYSQGMRQRLSLARALVHNPHILFLDEPFSNMDAGSSAQMAKVLARQRDEGKCILVVTHQPAVLADVADEFIIMSAGRIVERRPMAAVEARP